MVGQSKTEEPDQEDEYPTQDGEAAVGDFSGEFDEAAEEVYEEELEAAPPESYPSYAMGISM